MYYKKQDIRISTLPVSESLKYRKTAFQNYNITKQKNVSSGVFNQENIQPSFIRQVQSHNNNLQTKKQARRRSGSVGRIKRNYQSSQPLTESNSINKKVERQNQQNISVYKKLYDQNKVLNQALKMKIYPSNKQTNKSSQVNSYNYSYGKQSKSNNSQQLYKLSNNPFISQNTNQYEGKYQAMLKDYDKKKNFIKEEMKAIKQKSSLQSFQKYESSNKKQQKQNNATYDKVNNYQTNQQNFHTITNSKHSITQVQPTKFLTSNNKEFYLNKQFHPKERQISSSNQLKHLKQNYKPSETRNVYEFNSTNLNLLPPQTSLCNSVYKQDQIDKKYKVYQQKITKYQQFQKKTHSSISKFNQKNNSFDKIKAQTVYGTLPKQSSLKKTLNDSITIFSELMAKQIQKDQELRLIKTSLKKVPIEEVQSLLKTKFNVDINPQKIKLSAQEYDPFCEDNSSEIPTQQLLKNLLASLDMTQNYWNNLVKERFDKAQLNKIYDSLNYDKRTQLKLSQFARQLSLTMKKTFKGRQLFTVYQRLSPFTRQNFVQKLMKK